MAIVLIKQIIKTLIRRFFGLTDRAFGIVDHGRHTVIGEWLGPESVVIDLGCSEGRISRYFADTFGCRVYSVEASPVLSDQIERAEKMSVLNYAMSSKDGETTFFHSTEPATGNIVTRKPDSSGEEYTVPTRSLQGLLRELELSSVDLMKIDIEGSEVEMFLACDRKDLSVFRQLNVELHDRIRYPSTTAEESEQTLNHLRDCGFVGFDLGWNGWNWLFIRNDLLTKKHAWYLALRAKFRNTLGANY